MPDVTVKLSDGIREITVELNSSNDADPLARAEATAIRLWDIAAASKPSNRPAGFNGWALTSDTERSPEE